MVILALALTLRVAGLSGHMDGRLPPGALISALTLCQPETGWGKSEKQRQVLQKGGTEEKVGAEQLKFLQPSLRSRGGLGPSEKGQARLLLELYTFSIGKNRETQNLYPRARVTAFEEVRAS